MDRYGEDGTPFSGKIGPVGTVSVTILEDILAVNVIYCRKIGTLVGRGVLFNAQGKIL